MRKRIEIVDALEDLAVDDRREGIDLRSIVLRQRGYETV